MDYNQQAVYGYNPEYYSQQLQQYQTMPQDYQYYNQYYNQYATTEYPVTQTTAAPVEQVAEKGTLKSWFDFTDKNYLKGLIAGAGIAVVLGHPKVRKAIISGAVSTWDAVTCGFEELKEQVKDVRAEKSDKED